MIGIIKRILPRHIKQKILYMLPESNCYKLYNKNEKKIIITLGADYGNVGDVAITYAQTKFLKQNFPEYKIIEFPMSHTYRHMKSLKSICNKEDIITIVGGGNMGDLYIPIEERRRFVIKNFSNNKIVSFPQTIDFSKTKKGENEFKKTIKIYSKHKNLHIFAREQKSFDIMKKYFIKNNVHICPDIVLSLKKVNNEIAREKILVCLRNDVEGLIGRDNKNDLIRNINNKYEKVIFQDTHVGDDTVKNGDKYAIFIEVLNKFSSAKVVLTDRLHGMIFCIITNTPCVVLPNSNHKIKETYNNFLAEFESIIFIEKFNIDDIMQSVEKLSKINKEEKNQPDYYKEYMKIANIIKGDMNE